MNNTRSRLASRVLAVAAMAFAAPIALSAQADWCSEDDYRDDRFCEVREFTLRAGGSLAVDASPNGGVEVTAWDRNEVRVFAKVVGRGGTLSRAEELVTGVRIDTDGTIRAEGPNTRSNRDESWWVSYRVNVPRDYDLELRSTNGGVSVEGVRGEMQLQTTNGGMSLTDIGGDVSARTTNGGVSVQLTGSRWDGAGLEAITTNGGVTLTIPDDYNAHLVTGTRNGGMNVDFPITVQGRLSKTLEADLGSGGPPVTVRTTNGGVRIRRR